MAETKTKEQIMAEMDSAACDAEADLASIPNEALEQVANWWQKWYMKAGHKRLARTLLEYSTTKPSNDAKQEQKVELDPKTKKLKVKDG